MKDRQYLKNEILLCGESDGKLFKRTFHISEKKNEGSSSVCYEASYGGGAKGVLKEFYPRGEYGLIRTKEGQLVNLPEDEAGRKKFKKAEKAYSMSYEMLRDASRNGENRDLSTFIPPFEIYHGCDEDEKIIGTTYIWTPEPDREIFDEICDEIHKHPTERPEYKLVSVLSEIDSLTKCVCALHAAGMVHRDIKPSNFGFTKRGNETLTQDVSIFDINSVCSVYGEMEDVVGTEGFLEPEAGREPATNQTDIYSIGATLFSAIIVTDEAEKNGYRYRDEFYDRLQDMVGDSALIRASEANSSPKLRERLAKILQKSLCRREDRYANCEEMLEDLKAALYLVLPSGIANSDITMGTWVLKEAEKSLDVNGEKNSFLAIQYHLYEHPLYQCCPRGNRPIRVLVIGFGNYGKKFLDVCLSDGQIRGRRLQVVVVSNDSSDKDFYLKERPALTDFFNVDGCREGDADAYGDIAFKTMELDRRKGADNTDLMEKLMCETPDGGSPNYIFIALGDDSLNASAAAACKNAADILEIKCTVSYARENEEPDVTGDPALCPLQVNQDVRSSSFHFEIERMAFNIHLAQEKNLNIDFSTIRTEFRKDYNHDSCISSALYLKYTLHSIGIDLDAVGFEEAARQFQAKIVSRRNRNIRDELIWIEHRRWVTEKVCLGWRRLRVPEDCADRRTKDEKEKRHVCIVKSRPGQKLTDEYGKNGSHEKWDKASKKELEKLDDLDKMSVKLHLMYAKDAKKAKKNNLLYGSAMSGIRDIIEDNRAAVLAFGEWFACLKDIWNGDTEKVRLYRGLRDSFIAAVDTMPSDSRTFVNEQVKAFEAVFYPVLASMEYRDWKQTDAAIIDSIPFVLTYTETACMVIPFAVGDNTEIFGNVAAATVVNPERIIYLYLIEKKADMKALQDTIPYVIHFMRKKGLRAAVDFVLAYDEAAQGLVSPSAENEVMRLGERRIKRVTQIAADAAGTLPDKLKAHLRRRQIYKDFFVVEKNNTKLSYMLHGVNFYDSFDSYRFDSASMKFDIIAGRDMLRYIRKTPYITVTDMAALRLCSAESKSQPEFFDDYIELWERYSSNRMLWRRLCHILGEYSQKNDVIASFKKKTWKSENRMPETYRYIIPSVCVRSADKIIRALKNCGILGEGSHVNGHTSDSCEVIIHDRCGYEKEYARLFSQVYALMLPDDIDVDFDIQGDASVRFDSLEVRGVRISEGERGLIGYFAEKGYVINPHFDPGEEHAVAFTYASRQIKELLTVPGKILEIYAYHKVKELGRFDDVRSDVVIGWGETEVKTEADLILTKGFNSLFVECKVRPRIDQMFYYRLRQLQEQFGVNAKAVLIADTNEDQELFYRNTFLNDMQRERGNMLEVITVYDSDEIDDIGQTLLSIIDGDHKNDGEAIVER